MTSIKLNFLSLKESAFKFRVFRKIKTENAIASENAFEFSLPSSIEDPALKYEYLISFEEKDGFQEFEIQSQFNIHLTKRFIQFSLINRLKKNGSHYEFSHYKKGFEDRIEFILHKYSKGTQVIILYPYFYSQESKFGFLLNFKFKKTAAAKFDLDVQRLSLSLDQNNKSNKNFYLDIHRKLSEFIAKEYDQIKIINDENTELIELNKEMLEIPVSLLNKKEYVFNNKNSGYSQFQGVKNYGPYLKIEEPIIFVFIFLDEYRSFANEVYLSLLGKLNPGTFSGLEQMFKIHIGTDNVRRVRLSGDSKDDLSKALAEVLKISIENPNKKIMSIYIEDYSFTDDEDDVSEKYYFLKYNFLKNDLPLQVINYKRIGDKNMLKWSTGSLALALFSKMGGVPWVVKPSNNNCLILGLGSAHKYDKDEKRIVKHFAYTVCLDSSGLYKSLEVLAEGNFEETYLELLRNNLISLLENEKYKIYSTCVLHLPFKIKRKEIEAIKAAISQVADIKFVVIKVNLDNKYFGFSNHNTLVPYESSFIRLSKSEYLVWFEGLLFGKEIIDKRIARPVHIEFLNTGDLDISDERKYLQDVLNLSGANWRGFNAKSAPISIYYSQIIARYSEALEKIEGFDEKLISNSKPWFL
ncbi:piwi domain protein [Leptospira santarosai str. ST188]|uniref:Piwi domain-containing protein n=1 Tax=Leptospira santarosai TaxID=28183 RepID=UPI0002BC7AF0|nr:Piwi domain-containing protein [Leptospira santarosai]EMF92382.1 piwi domain protein [Leptospira santarosai str. ST188]